MQPYYNETSQVIWNCSAPNSFHKAAVCKCGSDFPLCQLRREAHSPALCHYNTKFPVIPQVLLQAPWLEQKSLAKKSGNRPVEAAGYCSQQWHFITWAAYCMFISLNIRIAWKVQVVVSDSTVNHAKLSCLSGGHKASTLKKLPQCFFFLFSFPSNCGKKKSQKVWTKAIHRVTNIPDYLVCWVFQWVFSFSFFIFHTTTVWTDLEI